jgi:hypothetical protein
MRGLQRLQKGVRAGLGRNEEAGGCGTVTHQERIDIKVQYEMLGYRVS